MDKIHKANGFGSVLVVNTQPNRSDLSLTSQINQISKLNRVPRPPYVLLQNEGKLPGLVTYCVWTAI